MAGAPVLVLAATRVELRYLLDQLRAAPPEGVPVAASRASWGDLPLVLARCGVGKANAAFSAGHLLAREAYRGVLHLGCAGAFPSGGLSVGDVVIGDREVFADEGALAPEGFLDLEALGLPLLEEGPVHNGVPLRPPFVLKPRDIARLSSELGFRVRAGPLATVSASSGTDLRAREVFERWKPLAESLEGAAVALAALRARVPCLEVRGISNLAGDRDRASWDIPLASDRAGQVAGKLLDRWSRVEKPLAGAGGRP